VVRVVTETNDNQHFVPQFYLRGFTIPREKSLIWEFDKEASRYVKTPRSIRAICSRYRYYRQFREDGAEEPDRLEQGFSREIEQKIAPVYKAILARVAEGTTDVTLTPMEYGQLCYSVAIQYTRVPSFRDKMALFMRIRGEQFLDQLVEEQRRDGTLPPQVDEVLRCEKPEVIIKDWGTIKTMLDAASTVSEALMDKTPGFFRPSPRSYFVTSDNPVSYYIRNSQKYAIGQIEPIHPDAEVLCPLSRNSAVIFFPRKSGYSSTRYAISCKCLDLLPPLVEMLNMQTAIMAARYIYAPARLDYIRDSLKSIGE